MKCFLKLFVFLLVANVYSQVDYSASWKDFYSYNNIVDFTKASGVVYAITENAVFTYNVGTNDVKKFSSVNGLSGKNTSHVGAPSNSVRSASVLGPP